MNAEDEINIRDINLLADSPNSDNTKNTSADNLLLTYHQKLKSNCKKIKDLCGTSVSKTQNRITMTWTVVEESIPNRLPVVVDRRDKLAGKIGLNNLLEFLYQFGYEEQNNSNNSCSFESVTSSNINRKVKSLLESVIFIELFFKLMYKD